MVAAQSIVDAFGSAGYRLTAPRRALAGLIASRSGHFTAEELLGEAQRRRRGLGRATIFRSLDVLAEPRGNPPSRFGKNDLAIVRGS